MNITPEQQNALVQFFGTMHAQAKQTDDMIVGSSKFVNPVSPTIRRELEQVLKFNNEQPLQQPPQQFQEPVYTPTPVDYIPVQETYTQEVQTVLPPTAPHEFVKVLDSEILNTLKEINLNLSRIASTLEKQHGSTKRAKNTKSG
jgi:hypothetical protein